MYHGASHDHAELFGVDVAAREYTANGVSGEFIAHQLRIGAA